MAVVDQFLDRRGTLITITIVGIHDPAGDRQPMGFSISHYRFQVLHVAVTQPVQVRILKRGKQILSKWAQIGEIKMQRRLVFVIE